jgi:hypothetical protein
MKSRIIAAVLLAGFIVPHFSSTALAADANPFLGRWDLTLKAPDQEYPPGSKCSSRGAN